MRSDSKKPKNKNESTTVGFSRIPRREQVEKAKGMLMWLINSFRWEQELRRKEELDGPGGREEEKGT